VDRSGRLDVGLISFNHRPGELEQCTPVEFGELGDIVVGKAIAICGFPFGNVWLTEAPGVWRFGPVVHHGMISAVSPYDTAEIRDVTTFLTDLNSANGMSGSPVFLLDSGRVIGLHYAGEVGTLGCAVPVDDLRVEAWVRIYERAMKEEQPIGLGQITLTPSGDLPKSSSSGRAE
ncbi:MAG: trypsin-like peptidase domain-containing protein, partial [Chloroflexi bacterium]|nr:trypsin-like peptidase domain-containing protein [Chloroflexota bacterium]